MPTTTHWAPYEPTETAPWNLERVVHLHRRAGFAASWLTLQRDLADGPRPSLDRMLAGDIERELPSHEFEATARSIAESATASDNPSRLKAWWLYRMLMSPDPLGERLALMWHNHFATSNRKVQNLVMMRGQNEVFRRQGRGRFAELLAAVIKQPAMLVWLDADSNRRGRPNENLARELMELFTLGIGNYTETDVKEVARSFTGWSVVEDRYEYRASRHDDGEKSVLGRKGRWTGDEIVRQLAEHPQTAQRIAWRILHTFLGDTCVDTGALTELAEGLHSRQLDIAWGVETVIRSQRFFSASNLRTRIPGPVEYVVGAIRALELCDDPPSTLSLAEWTAGMGHDLFYPPNVGGWHEGRAWLTSRSIVARANFASALVEGRLWRPERRPDLNELPRRHVRTAQMQEADAWLARLLWGAAPDQIVHQVVEAIHETTPDQKLAAAVAALLARPEHHLA